MAQPPIHSTNLGVSQIFGFLHFELPGFSVSRILSLDASQFNLFIYYLCIEYNAYFVILPVTTSLHFHFGIILFTIIHIFHFP